MDGSEHKRDVWFELRSFKRKFYFNQLLKGLILQLSIVLTAYLLANTLEFSFRFGTELRLVLFILLVLTFLISFYLFLLDPLLRLLGTKRGMSDQEAAMRIGQSFPSIQDRLLNLIQLRQVGKDNSLLIAGIEQKSSQVSGITYGKSIKYKDNGRYLKYILSPVSIIAAILLLYPSFITEPTERIVKFNDEFVPEAPFSFNIEREPFAFRNEDFTVSVQLEGNAFPQNLYLLTNGRKIKMNPLAEGFYDYTFKNLQTSRRFRFEGAGFFSSQVEVNVVERPNLKNFNVQLNFPSYTRRSAERLSNIGNLEIPEGTSVNWQFSTLETESFSATFLRDSSTISASIITAGLYEIDKRFYDSDNYLLQLTNKYSKNKDIISYGINVLKDEYPEISLTSYQDTVLYNMVVLGGNISDDYGLTQLGIVYSITRENTDNVRTATIPIGINNDQATQGYYYQWDLDSAKLESGDKLEYHLEVWDNDGINGRKVTKTPKYTFELPNREKLKEELESSTDKTEGKLQESINDLDELKSKLKEAEEKLRGKKNLDWEDEKLLNEILEKKEELKEALKELQEQNLNNQLKQERFTPQDESLKEKSQQLQERMEDLMDEETKRLFEELQKLLDEKSGVEQMQKLMEQLNRKQNNFQKELEQTMELFKRLKLENEINQVVNEMNELAEKQLELAEKTESSDENAQKLLEKQKELMDRFEKLKKDLEKVKGLNQELKNPESVPDQRQLKEDVKNEQENSADMLEKLNDSEKNQESQNKDESGQEESSKNEEGEKSEESAQKEQNSKEEEGSEKEEKGSEKSEESSEEGQQDETSPEQEQKSDSQESMKSKASKSQRKAGQKLKEMAQQMQQMQAGMEIEMMEENVDDLRNILHNLIKLSFDQEDLMEEFRTVNESDPAFVPLSQNQLKLQDDAKVIQDSLNSLAARAGQVGLVMTREVQSMNEHMDNSMISLKERRKYKAVSEQQFSMTAMNNLALMLDETLQNMMDALLSAKGQGKKGKKPKNSESLGEMQKKLNQQIQELKESGKSGRELSEELAKLATEQARIRKALEEMQKRLEEMSTDGNKTPGGDLPGKMENTEVDLINKRLTEQMIRRQQDILTRLLEAENAMRERELDDERKGETAKSYNKIIPRSFDEYLKQKEKEIEMLKTLPPKLYPYYKKEVSDYFKRIGESKN